MIFTFPPALGVPSRVSLLSLSISCVGDDAGVSREEAQNTGTDKREKGYREMKNENLFPNKTAKRSK